MSGQSTASAYRADDQRTVPDSELRETDRYNEGKAHSHKPNDPKDERSIANRLAREEKRDEDDDSGLSKEAKLGKEDPTLPAKSHGNEPSKGAKIDAEIQAEEEEILKKKGAWGSKQQ